MRQFFLATLVAFLALTAQSVVAQDKDKADDQTVAKVTAANSDEVVKQDDPSDKKADKKAAATSVSENRWFDITRAEISFRVRYIDGVPSTQRHSTNLQHREVFAGRFKFDKDAKYTINMQASSGYYFTRSFAETGVGLPWNQEQGWNIFLRHLYLSAKPVKGVEIQYGSMPLASGVLSENTTWDTDGYVAGQRLTVRRPDKAFFDEITVTYGYVGDFFKPNFFKRAQRLGQVNYRQYLVTKNIGSRVAVTAQYQSKNGTLSTDRTTPVNVETVHVGTKINAKGSYFADRVWLDMYRRVTPEPGLGYNLHAEKDFMSGRFTVGYGYVRVDPKLQNLFDVQDWAVARAKSPTLGMAPGGSPTGEKWTRGSHPFFTLNYKLSPEVTLFAYANRDLDQSFAHGSSSQMNAGITFDLLKAAKKLGWLK